MSYHIKNTADFVDKVSGLTISEDECLVSYDVTALFTNTPVNDTVNIIGGMLERENQPVVAYQPDPRGYN